MLRRRAFIGAFLVALVAVSGTSAAQDFSFEFGGSDSTGPPAALADSATSVATDVDGNVWVADRGNSRVVKYDYNGGFIAAFDRAAGGGPAFGEARSVAADDSGNVFVVPGAGNTRVVEMDTSGNYVRTIGPGAGGSNLFSVESVAADENGRILVLDFGRVAVYKPNGKFDRSVPVTGTTKGVAGNARSVFVSGIDSGGVPVLTQYFYSADAAKVRKLSGSPEEIDLDQAGRIFVSDYQNGVIRRYDADLVGEHTIGTQGILAGQMNGPVSVAVDCRGNVYGLDGAGLDQTVPKAMSKVLKFGVGGLPPPCAPPRLPKGTIDSQINDVEVTQAIQPARTYTAGPFLAPGEMLFDIPETEPRSRAFGEGMVDPAARTGELPLAAAHKTVVRVYAGLRSGPAGGIGGVPATLEAVTGSGKRLGPISATSGPAVLKVGDRTVTPAERLDPAGAYTFDLPDPWTRFGTLNFRARLNPAGIGCDAQCRNRSTFDLTGVPFDGTTHVDVAAVALTDKGQLPVPDPHRVFDLGKIVTPQQLEVWGYQGMVEVGDLVNADAVKVESCFLGVWPCETDTYASGTKEFREYLQPKIVERLDDFLDDRGLDRCDILPVGLIEDNPNFPGSTRGEFDARGLNPCGRSYAQVGRPLGAVAHEMQHAFGRPHAGRNCPGTGKGDDQEGEVWPPDNAGRLNGIGLDPRLGSGKGRGTHAIIAEGAPGVSGPLFDLMSYCRNPDMNIPDEQVRWISPYGWTSLHNWRKPSSADLNRDEGLEPAAAVRKLEVTATEFSDGKLGITSVSPTAKAPTDYPGSTYVLEALDANNQVLASSTAQAEDLAESSARSVSGVVEAPAGTTHVYLRHGLVATTRYGTKVAPKVKLLKPRRGSKVKSKNAVIRWKTRDRDGGELTAHVAYSANAGKKWQDIYSGPGVSGRVPVPRRLLAGSKRAKLRVTVDDGFNQGSATSGKFKVAASPPTVRITDPAKPTVVGADATVQLRGEAFKTNGRPLPGKALKWKDGRRRIGKGAAISLSGMRPGRHTITLAASASRKAGRDRLKLRVKAVKPAFLKLSAPDSISRKARKVKLKVASTVAAKLKIGKKHYRVGTRSKKITFPVKRGRRTLKLKLTLSVGKRSNTTVVEITR